MKEGGLYITHYVYILECKDKTLYVGCTKDLERRLIEHNNSKRGAHYTKIRRPVVLRYSEKFETFSEARKREAELKRFTRQDKIKLISHMKVDKGTLMSTMSTKDINSYIARYPKNVQVLLKQMRETIKKAAPKAGETIKYGLPTFVLNGNLVHFGGFKNHIGFYPTPRGVEPFKKELSKYKTTKGAIQFPIDEPLPLSLVTKIVKLRVKESVKRA